jgi:glycosyltransferase involved in cell wall biosynthesis
VTNKKLAEPNRPVSVIIPVRNAAVSICSTLQSLDQDRDVIYEILLIDDGSSDVTVQVAEAAAKEMDLPLTAVRVNFRSPGASRNAGLGKAKGRFVFFLDGDDQIVPGGLTALVRTLISHPDAGMAIGGYIRRTRGQADRLRRPSCYSMDRAANAVSYLHNKLRTIQIGSALVRRKALGKIRFADTLQYEEDVLFWTAVLSRNDVVTISRPVAIYNFDELRALLRQTSSAWEQFIEFSKEIRTLEVFGIEDQVIRFRTRWVAYRIARAFYLLGDPSAAQPFVRIASADPLLLLRLAWRRLTCASPAASNRRRRWVAEGPSDDTSPGSKDSFQNPRQHKNRLQRE